MRRLIKKIKDTINKFTTSKDKSKKTAVKEKTWDERKKELMSGVRADGGKKKETSTPTKPRPRKEPVREAGVKKEQPKEQPREQAVKNKPPYKSRSTSDAPPNRERPAARPVQRAAAPVEKKIIIDNWDPEAFKVEPEEGKKRFHDFDLPKEVMHAISDLGFKYCTPIQAAILSKTLAGLDASGKAQTGTGKTAAFLITMLTKFLNSPVENRKPGTPRALIMAPTRELVMQITSDAKALSKYTNLKTLSVVGGIDYQKQRSQLIRDTVDIIVATPGRLLDFYEKRDLNLGSIEILVIDEADRMMDMGFIPDMKKIIRATPHKDNRQTLLFSATLPPEVLRLASTWTKDSEVVDIEPDQVEGKNVEQIIYIVTTDQKYSLLYNTITKKNLSRVIVFTNRRDEAKKLMDLLYTHGINTAVLSGDVDQRKRMRVLSEFKEGKINILVATDVAGRGIHIEGISHVINFNLPEDPEDYVHRIGRTGRAGADGISISFACEDDSFQLPAIEKYLGHKLVFSNPDEDLLVPPPPPTREAEKDDHPKQERPRNSNSGTKRPYNPNYKGRSGRPPGGGRRP